MVRVNLHQTLYSSSVYGATTVNIVWGIAPTASASASKSTIGEKRKPMTCDARRRNHVSIDTPKHDEFYVTLKRITECDDKLNKKKKYNFSPTPKKLSSG